MRFFFFFEVKSEIFAGIAKFQGFFIDILDRCVGVRLIGRLVVGSFSEWSVGRWSVDLIKPDAFVIPLNVFR